MRSAPGAPEFVYFVQSHRGPAQVARLVGALKRGSPDCLVLVGQDGRTTPLSRGDLPDLPGVELFAVEGPVERGEISLLAPYFQAIARLAERGVEYRWLTYLSGQDYPTQPLSRSERELDASGADGFLRYWDAFAPVNPWGRRYQGRLRYSYRYFRFAKSSTPLFRLLRVVNGLRGLLHVHLTYGPHFGIRRWRTPFQDGFACYAGTQWTTLRRACVEQLLETERAQPELFAYYARTICADESLVQTILVNARRFRLVDDDLRYADMRGSVTGSPRTLTLADLPRLASGRCQFARKFDLAIDAAVLDRLDERLAASG